MTHLPLEGITVLEFCQYLSGPSAGLRLADLGARVIKIERPGTGDAGRKLAIKDLWVGDDSLLFHTINRNKESFTANLKDPADLLLIKKLITKADVLIHNFRPGIMEKIGLSYTDVQGVNSRLVYAEISGYGKEGPWKRKPGQDLLVQALTGLAYTTGNSGDAPMPFGLSIADMLCGAQLVQGILAALIRRQKKGKGALIEISLMESLLDFQFELLTTYFNSGKVVSRSTVSNGNPLLGAPYGIYHTKDGYIAIAMMDLQVLAEAVHCTELDVYQQHHSFINRDDIKQILTTHLAQHPGSYWMKQFRRHGLWAMEVLDWHSLRQALTYQVLGMEQPLQLPGGSSIFTTRCPIRINGQKLYSNTPAPLLGQHTQKIRSQL